MKKGDRVHVSGKTWVADGVITSMRGPDAPWIRITTRGEHYGDEWSGLDLGSVTLIKSKKSAPTPGRGEK